MLLELKQLKKYFPVKNGLVKAVDCVDLNIAQGENLGLVGESGSGKTTLGRMMMKLIPADAGEIVLDGTDIAHLSNRQMQPYRAKIQMVFQDPYSSLDPRYTVRRSILEAMMFDRTRSVAAKADRAQELLAAVQLPMNILERFPHEFSGGERQRIAIARALARDPELLILDEAVSSLDVLVQQQIIKLLLDIQKRFNVTYLFISHNLRVVRKLSQRVAVMWQGKIVELAKTQELLNNPLHPYTQELLSAALHYKTTSRNLEQMVLDEGQRLIDQGNGHFVLGK